MNRRVILRETKRWIMMEVKKVPINLKAILARYIKHFMKVL